MSLNRNVGHILKFDWGLLLLGDCKAASSLLVFLPENCFLFNRVYFLNIHSRLRTDVEAMHRTFNCFFVWVIKFFSIIEPCIGVRLFVVYY